MAQTQFRSDDTEKWWLGFGDGTDGDYSSAGNATDAPIDSACSGTAGTTSLSATNASFANGKPILIHQTRGTGAGNWELNQIDTYTAGTITTKKSLKNSYATGAQVIQLKQYSSFTQNSGHTLTAKAWNGTVGGIVAFLCKGTTTITGAISATGKGFVGGTGATGQGQAYCGYGYAADQSATKSANGSSGGGGQGDDDFGQGGAYATQGSNPHKSSASKGNVVGVASLVTMYFGGSGGGGSEYNAGYPGGIGGASGAIILIISKNVSIGGSLVANGNVGGSNAENNPAWGGGGAGGGVLIKAQSATLGTDKITATGGPSAQAADGRASASGGNGRIHLDYSVSYTGTTTPTIDVTNDLTIVDRMGGPLFYAQY